jgi:LytS/YehU family sensor histidine kinase
LSLKNIVISGIGNHYIIIVFLAIKVGRSWYRSKNKSDELQFLNLETQTEIYRYQLQPRIIYNLMDQLERISKTNPEKSSDMIIKISGFLNQMVYESQEELIPLDLDIKLIQNFLEIHKFALGDRFKINFEVGGNIKSHVVPPLLLLPFLENAIKIVYNCNDLFENTVFIKGEKRYLLFSSTVWSENEFEISDKKDLETIDKRLKFQYPGKYRLIENADSNFREISIEIFI